ncbi:hypothetical protein KP509_03G045600 [Ceratopteris richardii]|uniref:Uncharacterized protein n=1 Tax=Ceratopteris richardii TaxID=49495 RepID=A0A8T2V352_CERRI|nr:hypothetical protein KP509_03G045600 [Ceratopteris richardii]
MVEDRQHYACIHLLLCTTWSHIALHACTCKLKHDVNVYRYFCRCPAFCSFSFLDCLLETNSHIPHLFLMLMCVSLHSKFIFGLPAWLAHIVL